MIPQDRNANDADLLGLAQKWMSGNISQSEMIVLNDWYYALEGTLLKYPDEFTMDKLEKRLHEHYYRPQRRDSSIVPPWENFDK